MKRCKNKITIAHYNNGKSQVIGSTGIVSKSLSINGHYTDEVCNGKIKIDIYISGSYECPELCADWRCSKCGITINDPTLPNGDNLQEWINKILI